MMMFLLLTKIIFILLASLISLPFGNSKGQSGCFESIISLGDSLADTGNLALLGSSTDLPHSAFPPYGRTFFHHPTGRYSDGRLVIDFVAEALGLPYVQPYIGGRNGNTSSGNFKKGVNFAVAGATALDTSLLEKRGIFNMETNVSLGIEIQWFRQFLATLPDGRKYLEGSLIIAGEIGGNDYNHALLSGINIEYIKSLVPEVVNYIGLIIQELIGLGARTLLVPGITPIGCLPVYLTIFTSKNARDYDHKNGCLNSMNELALYHNEFLQRELNVLQELYPDVAIIYADYYNALITLHLAPQDFGFTSGALKACCGGGGLYNYNRSATCGFPSTTCCDDPSSFISWDGIHLTEAAYRLVAKGLLEGPFTVPQIKTACPALSTPGDKEYSDY